MKVRINAREYTVPTCATAQEIMHVAGIDWKKYRLMLVKEVIEKRKYREVVNDSQRIDVDNIDGFLRFETVSRRALQG